MRSLALLMLQVIPSTEIIKKHDETWEGAEIYDHHQGNVRGEIENRQETCWNCSTVGRHNVRREQKKDLSSHILCGCSVIEVDRIQIHRQSAKLYRLMYLRIASKHRFSKLKLYTVRPLPHQTETSEGVSARCSRQSYQLIQQHVTWAFWNELTCILSYIFIFTWMCLLFLGCLF